MSAKVTAIITVFNEAEWIARAVRSLLAQSLRDVEVLVVNDGSTDGTAQVLAGISDDRLRVLHLPRTGRAAALVIACREASGCYIANLDADDVSNPLRLQQQADFLDAHPDHVWVGSGEEQHDNRRHEHHQRIYPLTDAAIRRQSAKCIPYCHSSVMFRRRLITDGINYDPAQPYLIDFEFFLRVAQQGQVANLPEVLVTRYVRAESYFQRHFTTSVQNRRLARLSALAVRRFHLPVHYYLFPLVRLLYPLMPRVFKRWLRRRQGLQETHA